jgi:outer membrane protein TolC
MRVMTILSTNMLIDRARCAGRIVLESGSRLACPAWKAMLALVLLGMLPAAALAFDDPHRLAEDAVRANPRIEARRAHIERLSALANVAGTWTDPMVSIEYLNVPVDSFRIDERVPSGLQFQLQQKLPAWGWSSAAANVADGRVAASRFATREAELQLRSVVEVLFWKLTLSNQLEAVTNDHVQRTRELLDAVTANYEVGRVGQNAVLRLQVLRDRLEDNLGDFERAEREISAALVRAAVRPVGTRFDTPGETAPIALEETATGWLEQARRSRPLLGRLREEVGIERKAAQLARIKTRPDVNVWFKYRVRTIDTPMDDGTDFVSLGLAVPIPWGSLIRGRGEEAAHLHGERSAQARLSAALDSITFNLTAIEASWSRAFDKATRYRDHLIPAARATVETTLSDFSVGKADFASLYESEVELLELERAYLNATIVTYQQRTLAGAETGMLAAGGSR